MIRRAEAGWLYRAVELQVSVQLGPTFGMLWSRDTAWNSCKADRRFSLLNIQIERSNRDITSIRCLRFNLNRRMQHLLLPSPSQRSRKLRH